MDNSTILKRGKLIMAKITYKKCPRCELNYIDSRLDMCDVCKEELGQPLGVAAEDDDEDLKELCPICKRNYISFDEEMCEECRLAKEESSDPVIEDDNWRVYLEDTDTDIEEEKKFPSKSFGTPNSTNVSTTRKKRKNSTSMIRKTTSTRSIPTTILTTSTRTMTKMTMMTTICNGLSSEV